jgi:hypothetical protein
LPLIVSVTCPPTRTAPVREHMLQARNLDKTSSAGALRKSVMRQLGLTAEFKNAGKHYCLSYRTQSSRLCRVIRDNGQAAGIHSRTAGLTCRRVIDLAPMLVAQLLAVSFMPMPKSNRAVRYWN